jgi:hypothetical protein
LANQQEQITLADTATIALGALAGGLGARLLDEAPLPEYDFAIGGRQFTVRPSAAVAAVAIGAALLGYKLPAESVILPMAAGALAYEVTEQAGDDIADLILGLPAAPTTAGALPPGATVPTAYMYPGGYVDDYTLRQALG